MDRCSFLKKLLTRETAILLFLYFVFFDPQDLVHSWSPTINCIQLLNHSWFYDVEKDKKYKIITLNDNSYLQSEFMVLQQVMVYCTLSIDGLLGGNAAMKPKLSLYWSE